MRVDDVASSISQAYRHHVQAEAEIRAGHMHEALRAPGGREGGGQP